MELPVVPSSLFGGRFLVALGSLTVCWRFLRTLVFSVKECTGSALPGTPTQPPLTRNQKARVRRCKRQAFTMATATVTPPQQLKLSAAAPATTPPFAKQRGGACRAEVARWLVLRCPDPSLLQGHFRSETGSSHVGSCHTVSSVLETDHLRPVGLVDGDTRLSTRFGEVPIFLRTSKHLSLR